MSLADTELSIGGVKFKGIYIAVVLSLATTIGGGVWTASSLYSRLEGVESRKIPNVTPIKEDIQLIQQQLLDNDVSKLQGKLAELGANLITIKSQQEKLLELNTDVSQLSKDIETIKGTVAEAKVIADSLGNTDKDIKLIKKEIDDLWQGMDYLSNPLGK
jgi:chromosome segregation ATPase